MTLLEKIREIPLFDGLPAEQLQRLAAIAREQNYDKGELIFSEGDEADGLYFVADGRVKIFKLGFDGKEQILHLFESGEPFGEVAVFTGRAFPAYAQAMLSTRVVILPRQALVDQIRAAPDLCLGMLAILSMRLRRFANLIEDLSLKEVPTRLAAYLLYVSQKQDSADIELDMTKSQLASLLGTIPETLSRILAKMVKQSLIKVDGRRFIILDRTGLEELAGSLTRL